MKNLLLLSVALLLTACSTTTPPLPDPGIRDTDPMIAQLSETARKAFEAGESTTAATLYRRALARARAMDNSREIGLNAYNLAACLIGLEQWDEALRLLTEAERETLRAGGNAGPVILLAAQTARWQGEFRQAEAAIDRLERLPLPDPLRGEAYALRAHLACDRQDASRAQGFLNRARGYIGRNPEPGLAGTLAEVSGRIALLRNDWSAAAAAFDEEAAWLRQAARLPEMAASLDRAGRYHLAAGNIDLAADRFYRSARSWMAQGNYLQALRVIEQAIPPDGSTPGNAEDDLAALMTLFEDIRLSVEQQSQAINR